MTPTRTPASRWIADTLLRWFARFREFNATQAEIYERLYGPRIPVDQRRFGRPHG